MQEGEVDREVEKVLSAVRGKGEVNPLARLVVRDRSGRELSDEREQGIRRLAAVISDYLASAPHTAAENRTECRGVA